MRPKRARHVLWLDTLARHWLRIPPGIETLYLRDDEDPKPDIDIDWYADRMRRCIDLDAFRHAREILLREPRQRGIRRATQAALRLTPMLPTLERYEHELNRRLDAARERNYECLVLLPDFSLAATTESAPAVRLARPGSAQPLRP